MKLVDTFAPVNAVPPAPLTPGPPGRPGSEDPSPANAGIASNSTKAVAVASRNPMRFMNTPFSRSTWPEQAIRTGASLSDERGTLQCTEGLTSLVLRPERQGQPSLGPLELPGRHRLCEGVDDLVERQPLTSH